ncbi:hypothetical protein [Blastococcus sp. TF02A-26]|uniref:hypothetical protein n=1 Tax=Blastococcus sp. TF02A-26 TaxID=2250577 RepID=UPI000DE8C53F|nr:hypothetical protein [Blastococcus sp. TF02A-26]RBY86105.1 hypothetical protein DQ240_09830 [Blastococcus sp. TF02A-26]
MTAADDARLVLPVGQYLGALVPAAGAPVRGHRVRVGEQVHLLADGPEFEVWSLAHGVPQLAGLLPTDSAQLTRLASAIEPAEVARILTDLTGRGLLALVDPADASGFARGHRWYSLLGGLGYQQSGNGAIGLVGSAPIREVAPRVYEFWSLAPLFGDLRAAAEFLAGAAADDPDPVPAETDPAAVVGDLVGWLHDLLCVGAGWLDVRLPGTAP